jgi:hypothetical protein
LKPLESVAGAGFSGKFRKAYNIDMLQIYYSSKDIHSTLFYVEIESGLTISVLRDRTTRYKNFELGNQSEKKSLQRPPNLFISQAGAYSWSKVMIVSQIGFY